MSDITVSAPGKINLMGEHAIVYGYPSLLSSINFRTKVTVSDHTSFIIRSNTTDTYIRHAVDVVCRKYHKKIPQVLISVSSTIRPGYHLGSSAAIAVSVVGAFSYFFTKTWDLDVINALAYETEKLMHGNPSGGDNTTVTFGGFILFEKKSETEKKFTKLPIQISPLMDNFYLINTGHPKENTGGMVSLVRSNYEKDPDRFRRIFEKNKIQTGNVRRAIEEKNEDLLIHAIIAGESTLEEMGVVSQHVLPVIRDIEKAGGAAKILGGGGIKKGVGYLLCYHKDMQKISPIAHKYGYTAEKIILGTEGVMLHI